MGVLFESRSSRAVRRHRAVAIEADRCGGFSELRIIFCAVRVVTVEARHAAPIHNTLHKIIPLHSVLVGGAIGVVRESRFTEFVIL